jgi:hypothetical protein
MLILGELSPAVSPSDKQALEKLFSGDHLNWPAGGVISVKADRISCRLEMATPPYTLAMSVLQIMQSS